MIPVEMARGDHDDKYSWVVSRLGLDHLASFLKDSSREKTQVWLTSRCEFTFEKHVRYSESVISRVFHDQLKAVYRNSFLIDKKTGWADAEEYKV